MSERITFSAPAKLAAALKKRAKASGRSIAAETVVVLLEALGIEAEAPQHGGAREGAGRPKKEPAGR